MELAGHHLSIHWGVFATSITLLFRVISPCDNGHIIWQCFQCIPVLRYHYYMHDRRWCCHLLVCCCVVHGIFFSRNVVYSVLTIIPPLGLRTSYVLIARAWTTQHFCIFRTAAFFQRQFLIYLFIFFYIWMVSCLTDQDRAR